MRRIALTLAASLALAAPVAANSLGTLLPSLSFPPTMASPSTKDCAAPATPVCQTDE